MEGSRAIHVLLNENLRPGGGGRQPCSAGQALPLRVYSPLPEAWRMPHRQSKLHGWARSASCPATCYISRRVTMVCLGTT